MPPRLRRLTLLLVAPALVAAGCGGSSGGDASVSTLLNDTFSGGKAVKSGDLDVSLGFQGQGLPTLSGPVALKLSGPFQSNGSGKLPSFDFDLSLDAGGQAIQAGAISLGDKGWIKFSGNAYTVPAQLFDQFRTGYEQSQKSSQSKDSGNSFKALGIDPARWLKDARKSGTTDVGGTKTIHITSSVDVPRFLDDVDQLLGKAQTLGAGSQGVPQGISDRARTAIERSVKSAKVDVYTGSDDHALRRLTLDVSLAVPKDVQSDAGGLKSGELRFDLTIADLNSGQNIGAPANAKPLSDLQQALGALQGGGSSSQSGTQTAPAPQSGSGSGSGAGGAPQAYLDCVQKAGTDISAVQKCAELVNGG